MKKIMIMLAMIIAVTTHASASVNEIKPEVLEAFKNKFGNVQDVVWAELDDFYKASFQYRGEAMTAYYDKNARLIGVARNIPLTLLPLFLQNSLKKNYNGYWITDLFEISKKHGFGYYITLRNADTKIILKSESGNDWEIYQKQDL